MKRVVLLPRPSLKASSSSSSSSPPKTTMPPPSPISKAISMPKRASDAYCHLLDKIHAPEQRQQVRVIETPPSVISTIQQIKIDFDQRRSINAESKLKLADLRSQIVSLKDATSKLSSRIMSINAGIAFRERKELVPTREDIDELGRIFDQVYEQTKHLKERLKIVKKYRDDYANSENILKFFIESASTNYRDALDKILSKEESYSEMMKSHQSLSLDLEQTAVEDKKLVEIIYKKEMSIKERKEVMNVLDQELEKLRCTTDATKSEVHQLEGVKAASIETEQTAIISSQKTMEAIIKATKVVFDDVHGLKSEIERCTRKNDAARFNIDIYQSENDKTRDNVLGCVDLLDKFCECNKQEESNLTEIEDQANITKDDIRMLSDELKLKVEELDSYKDALSDMNNVRSKRLENLKASENTLKLLQQEVLLCSTTTTTTTTAPGDHKSPRNMNFHSCIESIYEDIAMLIEASETTEKHGRSVLDRLITMRETLQGYKKKESQLRTLLNESSSHLVDANNNYNLCSAIERSNNDLTLQIEERQQELTDKKDSWRQFHLNCSQVHSHITKLRKQDTTTVIPTQSELNKLKHEITTLQTQMKNLQSGHSKFAMLDVNRDQELSELRNAIRQEEEKFDTGPRRRQKSKEIQKKSRQMGQNLIITSTIPDPIPTNDGIPEDSDSNDFFFNTSPDITYQLKAFSSNLKYPKEKEIAPCSFHNDDKMNTKPHINKKKKQITEFPIGDRSIISLNHSSASKILRCKSIKKYEGFDNKHWLQDMEW